MAAVYRRRPAGRARLCEVAAARGRAAALLPAAVRRGRWRRGVARWVAPRYRHASQACGCSVALPRARRALARLLSRASSRSRTRRSATPSRAEYTPEVLNHRDELRVLLRRSLERAGRRAGRWTSQFADDLDALASPPTPTARTSSGRRPSWAGSGSRRRSSSTPPTAACQPLRAEPAGGVPAHRAAGRGRLRLGRLRRGAAVDRRPRAAARRPRRLHGRRARPGAAHGDPAGARRARLRHAAVRRRPGSVRRALQADAPARRERTPRPRDRVCRLRMGPHARLSHGRHGLAHQQRPAPAHLSATGARRSGTVLERGDRHTACCSATTAPASTRSATRCRGRSTTRVALAEIGDAGGPDVRRCCCIGLGCLGRLAGRHPVTGRALLREIRQSFYRKLFLLFVAASVVPVLALAFVTRAYVAGAAARRPRRRAPLRTASAARRVIETVVSQQRRDRNDPDVLNDDVMVSVSRIIDQDVNVFVSTGLVATSQRDLFASGLLPTRTPAEVGARHRPRTAGQLRRRRAAGAAAVHGGGRARPRRRGGRDSHRAAHAATAGDRARDRRARSPRDAGGGAASSCSARRSATSTAERIADPVNRLTRATRPHRTRRPRRAHSRVDRPTSCGGWSTPSTRWPPTCSASAASSSARTASRRGPTWRGRSRTTSRTR